MSVPAAESCLQGPAGSPLSSHSKLQNKPLLACGLVLKACVRVRVCVCECMCTVLCAHTGGCLCVSACVAAGGLYVRGCSLRVQG